MRYCNDCGVIVHGPSEEIYPNPVICADCAIRSKNFRDWYHVIAKVLVKRVKEINPDATVIKNYQKDSEIVVQLIISYHRNLGDRFLISPFSFMDVERFL